MTVVVMITKSDDFVKAGSLRIFYNIATIVDKGDVVEFKRKTKHCATLTKDHFKIQKISF